MSSPKLTNSGGSGNALEVFRRVSINPCMDALYPKRPRTFTCLMTIRSKMKLMRELTDKHVDSIIFVLVALSCRQWLQIATKITHKNMFDQFMHRRVIPITLCRGPKQGTKEWLEQRYMYLTGSLIAAILGMDEHQTPKKAFYTKCDLGDQFAGNIYTRWGNHYEMEAARVYKGETGYQPIDGLPLIRHPTIPFLAASPDFITRCGRAGEIKCPPRRPIHEKDLPKQYEPQVHLVMECCNLEVCDFVQYHPSVNGEPYQYTRYVIKRDRHYFDKHMPTLQRFYNAVLEYRATGVIPIEYKKRSSEERASYRKRICMLDIDNGY